MALGNLLVSGSYTVVSVNFNKHDKSCLITHTTYTDSNKLFMMASGVYEVRSIGPGNTYKSKTTTTPPGSPSEGDKYYIPPSSTGDWSAHISEHAEYVSAAWVYTPNISGTNFIRVEDEGKLYSVTEGTWTEEKRLVDNTGFDGWFGTAQIEPAGSNLIKRSYDYLKSLPEFSGVTDV